MLSRTADSLYWTGRYIERADFLARILEATIRLAAIPTRGVGDGERVWASALACASVPKARGRSPTETSVRAARAFSPESPSSAASDVYKRQGYAFGQARYWSWMACASRPFSARKAWMYSCRPDWKMESMRELSNDRIRSPASRCAGPRRP